MMKIVSIRILLPALALGVEFVAAFWRLECDGNVGLARLDPLVSPGSVSDHVHSIKGGSAFSSSSNANDLLKSKCTSCGVTDDLSAYWAPALYFINDDGSAEIVPEKPPHKSYYLMRGGLTHDGKTQKVEAFPLGFSMISGNNFRRNTSIPDPDPNPLGPWPGASQDDLAQRAIGFNCLNYKAAPEPALQRHKLPDKAFLDANCLDGVRLELQFPSCWNGNLDGGPSNKAHVAFPDGVQVGNCPQGFDRRLITLMYETIVATDSFRGRSGKFVLANGDPTGYGYHGDFIAAWKGDTLERALQSCDAGDSTGVMQDCPVFQFTQNSASCQLETPLPPSIANEAVKGPLKGGLPNVQIQYGPAPATPPGPAQPAGNPPSSPAPPPTTQPAPAQPPPAKADMPKVAQKNQVANGPAAQPPPSSPPKTTVPVIKAVGAAVASVTPAPAQSPPELQAGERIINTVYSTQGDIVYEIVNVVKDEVVEQRKRDLERQQHARRHLRHHHHGYHKHLEE